MFDRVKAWVFERGGKLLYLGGNGLNCEVELFVEPGASTPGISGVRYLNGKLRGLTVEGLGGFESRMHLRHESEASLVGSVFTTAGAMTGAPYRVMDGSHWIFAGTGLKTGDIFGEKCLHQRCPGGASGHETDKVSASSPKNVTVIAKGLNPDDGGAEMLVFDTPSGGRVFSASSINYVSSLPVDEFVSRITATVLRSFLDSK